MFHAWSIPRTAPYVLFCTGKPGGQLHFYDPLTLEKIARIPINLSVTATRMAVPVRDSSDVDRRVFALTTWSEGHGVNHTGVSIGDFDSLRLVARFSSPTFSDPLLGLASVPGCLSSRPLIVFGGNSLDVVDVVIRKVEQGVVGVGKEEEYFFGVIRNVFRNKGSFLKRLLHVFQWPEGVYCAGGDCVVGCDLTRQEVTSCSLSHSAEVKGLSADVSRNLVFSTSADMTCAMFSRRLDSGLERKCQGKFQLSGPGFSSYYAEDQDLLYVGLDAGKIEIFDPRFTEKSVDSIFTSMRLLRGHRRRAVLDIDRIDENSFVSGSNWVICAWESSSKRLWHRAVQGNAHGVCVLGGWGNRKFEAEYLRMPVGRVCFPLDFCFAFRRIDFVGLSVFVPVSYI